MKSSTSLRFSSVFFFLFFILSIVAAIAEDSNAEEDITDLQAVQCVYAVSVQTGTVTNAGTDSLISLKPSNVQGSSFNIPNLRSWGLMLPGYNYFENGNLDFFVGRGPCLNPPQVCRITVTSDGSGISPGWYLKYVDITTFGPNYKYRYIFQVNQWLDAPFQLSTTSSYC